MLTELLQDGNRLGAMTTARFPASIRECPAPLEILLRSPITTHRHCTHKHSCEPHPPREQPRPSMIFCSVSPTPWHLEMCGREKKAAQLKALCLVLQGHPLHTPLQQWPIVGGEKGMWQLS